MLSILFAASSTGDSALAPWLIGAGILGSCGLAVAAGFCSFFPPLAWIGLASMFLSSTRPWVTAAPTRFAFYAGLAASVGMLVLQAWRVRTGRFVPTIETGNQDSA